MNKKQKIISWSIYIGLIVILLIASILVPGSEKEDISDIMNDAVLHGSNLVAFGFIEVNPAYISSLVVTGTIILFAIIVRIFFIPRFKYVPGKLQLALEQLVSFFDNLAITNSPKRNKFLGAYIFGAGVYIFVGTIFELVGIQATGIHGNVITLPAPLSDINAAIAIGCLSYLVILVGGLVTNGFKGVLKGLKDFSLPISMSFRLFGALLSGLLVSELVYYYIGLSYVLPVVVGVLFTLIHALVQAYVLAMLTALFYGEVSEKHPKKEKNIEKA